MLQFGKNITAPADPLHPLSVETYYRALVNPKQQFADYIAQLRAVKSIDEKRYRELKKQLPYLVCGLFHPPVRRKENFASIQCFIMDLDHFSEAGRQLEQVRQQMQADERVMLGFVSPGADGLKLLFRLSQPCTDAALFSAFYKLFARHFAEQHDLMQVVDFRTSDVTRACFMSVDAEAWYRPEAQPIQLSEYVDALNFGQAEKDLKEAEKTIKELAAKRESLPTEPPADVLTRIRQKLNPNARQPRQKQYYVPEEVDQALAMLQQGLAPYEMQIVETAPINYGRKVRVKADQLWAEINIFYGKRGFSVVKTTKSGSNAELAELAAGVISQLLSEQKPRH